jgi:hypothetical protein
VTGALARGTAGRALGSATAVAALPVAVGQVGLTTAMAIVAGLLCGAVLVLRRRVPQERLVEAKVDARSRP